LAISATTGAGTAPLARRDEHHVGALQRLLDVGSMLFGRLTTYFRIAPRTQSARQLPTEVQLQVGVAHEQCLGIGVGSDELHVAEPRVDHAIDGVDTTATDPNHLDDGQVVTLGLNGGHGLPRVRVDRRPIALWISPPRATS
jgi:hypothetical protein